MRVVVWGVFMRYDRYCMNECVTTRETFFLSNVLVSACIHSVEAKRLYLFLSYSHSHSLPLCPSSFEVKEP